MLPSWSQACERDTDVMQPRASLRYVFTLLTDRLPDRGPGSLQGHTLIHVHRAMNSSLLLPSVTLYPVVSAPLLALQIQDSWALV